MTVCYNQKFNFYQHVYSQINLFGDAVRSLKNIDRNSVHGKLCVSLSSYGYGDDGNTIILDEEHIGTISFYIDVVVHRRGITWVRVTNSHFSEEPFKMTGNHDTCYFEGWDRDVMEDINDTADLLLPEDYWEMENHSIQPISVFTSIRKLQIIEDPEHIADPNSDHTFGGYVRLLQNQQMYR